MDGRGARLHDLNDYDHVRHARRCVHDCAYWRRHCEDVHGCVCGNAHGHDSGYAREHVVFRHGDVHGYAFLCMSLIGVFLIYQEGKRYKEEVKCL